MLGEGPFHTSSRAARLLVMVRSPARFGRLMRSAGTDLEPLVVPSLSPEPQGRTPLVAVHHRRGVGLEPAAPFCQVLRGCDGQSADPREVVRSTCVTRP